MGWFSWSDTLKKRACRYLLHRYSGQFLLEKLSLDQLSIDLFNGRACLEDIQLDVKGLNDLAQTYNVPFVFVDGYIRSMEVMVPWSKPLTDNSTISISGLQITLQPRPLYQAEQEDASLWESMMCSMMSSMQMAEEILKEKDDGANANDMDFHGMEEFANAIESVFSRIRLSFKDTVIRLERALTIERGIALECRVDSIEFYDEAAMKQLSEGDMTQPAIALKRVALSDLDLFVDFFETPLLVPGEEELSGKFISNPILVSHISGEQLIRLHVKRQNGLPDPDVKVEAVLKQIPVLLRPEYVHWLLHLFRGFSETCENDDHLVASRYSATHRKGKPMNREDFERCERHLFSINTNKQPHNTAGDGWSTVINVGGSGGSVGGESDDDGVYHLAQGGAAGRRLRATSGTNRPTYGVNASAEDSPLFHLRTECPGVIVVLMHRNTTPDEEVLTNSDAVEAFFRSVAQNPSSKFHTELRGIIVEDHLRIVASAVRIEGCTYSSGTLDVSTTIGEIYLLELLSEVGNGVLQSPNCYKILSPMAGGQSHGQVVPMLRLSHKTSSHASCSTKDRQSYQDCSWSMELGACCIDIDRSLEDRIHLLLHPGFVTENQTPTVGAVSHRTPVWQDHSFIHDLHSIRPARNVFSISSSQVDVILRFPVPDLRPSGPIWWRPNLRPDSIRVKLEKPNLKTQFFPTDMEHEFLLTFSEAVAYYQADKATEALPFLRIGSDHNAGACFEPSIQFRIQPSLRRSLLEESVLDDNSRSRMMKSMTQSFCFTPKVHEDIIFTPRHVFYQNADEALDEVLLPSDQTQLDKFIEDQSSNSYFNVSCFLPVCEVLMPDRTFFEVIYNRFSNDIVLWEPSMPSSYTRKSKLLNIRPFQMCQSMHRDEIEDEEIDDELTGSGSTDDQTYLTIHIQVQQGLASIGGATPECKARSELIVDNGSIFTAVNANGDPNKSFTIITSNGIQLWYNPKVSSSRRHHPANFRNNMRPNELLLPVIVPSEAGVLSKFFDSQSVQNNAKALSLVLKMHAQPQQKLKTVLLSALISNSTLFHRNASHGLSWLQHWINFFDITDVPVEGYVPSNVLTQMHLNIQNCAIDYNSPNCPHHAVATLDRFSISSNIAAQTSTSVLRLIGEDICLFVSDKKRANVILSSDFICVLQAGLIDLLIRLTYSKNSSSPDVMLRASNDVVHLRTCSDSLIVLQKLLETFVTEISDPTTVKTSVAPVGVKVRNETNDHEHIRDMIQDAMQESEQNENLSSDESYHSDEGDHYTFHSHEHYDSAVSEAENDVDDDDEDDSCSTPKSPVAPVAPMAPVASVASPISKMKDTDDEFFVLDEQPGTGILPRDVDNMPIIRLLSSDPVEVIDDYFEIPVGKIDQLASPSHYSKPLSKYTLQEMSLVWHMYGGRDFDIPSPTTESVVTNTPKRVTMNVDTLTTSYSTKMSDSTCSEDVFNQLASTPIKRLEQRGGIGRKTNVLMELRLLKVRCQYEQYNESVAKRGEASRIVLLISDIRLMDRLESSPINQFMYQYATAAQPRQSNSNMVSLRMLQTRSLDIGECADSDANHMYEWTVRATLKPLRFNIDQDALIFLVTFFTELLGIPEAATNGHVPAPSSGNLNLRSSSHSHLVPYIRSFDFTHDCPIRIDYKGRHIALENGALKGILLGLGELHCLDIVLKSIHYRQGVLGTDRLVMQVAQEWLSDIRRRQIPNVIGGVGPMHAFVQLFQGFRDLFWLPVEQYRKDGRVVRGIQRGAASFSSSSALALIELTQRCLSALQSIAQITYDVVSPTSVYHGSLSDEGGNGAVIRRQPMDIREGVTAACQVVSEGIEDTARQLCVAASMEQRNRGTIGAVGSVLRQLPSTIVRPVIVLTEAGNSVLGGVHNQILPDSRQEAMNKWKAPATVDGTT